MTLTLELTPEVEAALSDQAKAKGVSLDIYLQRIIENLAQPQSSTRPSPQEIFAALDRLAEMGKDLPRLPSSAFTRESIYRDHD
jgi:hypothetical protein